MKKLGISIFTATILILSLQNSFAQENLFPKEGNAGIGTVEPLSQLNLFNKDKACDLRFDYYSGMDHADFVHKIQNDNGVLQFLFGKGDHPNSIDFEPYLTLFDNRLGLNVSNPFTSLHVNGNAAIGYSSLSQAPGNGLLVKGKVGFDIIDPLTSLQIGNLWTYSNQKDKVIGYNVYMEDDNKYYRILFRTPVSAIKQTIDGRIVLSTAESGAPGSEVTDWNESLIVYNNGNVGVLTELNPATEPDIEFSVNGDMQVVNLKLTGSFEIKDKMKIYANGKLWAQEMQVAIDDPWADFVFEENYNLKTLTEVENYIKENNHLPDLPSAKDVETNGINVAKMNSLLLQKIEELTLYVIEQEKAITTLKGKLEKLEKSN